MEQALGTGVGGGEKKKREEKRWATVPGVFSTFSSVDSLIEGGILLIGNG